MRKMVLALAGLATLAAGPALAKPVTAKVSPKVVSDDRFPAPPAHFPGGVVGHADLVYSTLPGYRPMTLDLYVPAKAKGPKPLVIYIHGGGWVGGTARNAGAFTDFPAVLAELAARGYVVASLNYRLSGEARFPAAIEDVRDAIRWLRAHAADYGIDKARVGVWGGSAGGQLAALAAFECKAGEGKTEGACVQSAVLWYAVTDFSAHASRPAGPDRAVSAYLGCVLEACPETVRAASPIDHVDAKAPPTLLVQGDADRTAPIAESRATYAKLKAAGVKTELVELPGLDHSFLGKTPAETGAGSLKALQASFDWFDTTLGKR